MLLKVPKNEAQWLRSIADLPWEKGSLDESSWRAFCNGARLQVSDEVMLWEIARRIQDAGDAVRTEKLCSQIRRAKNQAAAAPQKATAKQAKFDPAKLEALAAKACFDDPVEVIRARSAIAPESLTTVGVLQQLYRPGEKVAIFLDQKAPAVFWSADQPYSVNLPSGSPKGVLFLANPVDGLFHFNPRQKKDSNRSEESITAFRYAVLESDTADEKPWSAFLGQIPAPIAAIYRSGGRSVHALLQIDAGSKKEWDYLVGPLKKPLAVLGADPGCLSAVRLSRLPQAWRADRQQELIYIRPDATATPIFDLPVRPIWNDWIWWLSGLERDGSFFSEHAAQFREGVAGFEEEPDVMAWLEHLTAQGL